MLLYDNCNTYFYHYKDISIILQNAYELSKSIEFQTHIRKSLVKHPTTEVENRFTDYRWVTYIQMTFFHFLKLFNKDVIHKKRQIGPIIYFAELRSSLQIID